MRITILGLGNMGRAFAGRALERGHDVTVWNRSAGQAAELVAKGATEAGTRRAAAADADVVLVVLADDAAVESVCLGDDGVLAALGPTAVLANVSTVSPDTVRRLAEAGPPERVLDAPVMGSPAAVAAGQGRFLVGGPLPTIRDLDPLWHDLGAGIHPLRDGRERGNDEARRQPAADHRRRRPGRGHHHGPPAAASATP